MEDLDNKDVSNYNETFYQKWIFRIVSIFFICLFCYFVIKYEIKSMVKNENTKISTLNMLKEINISISNLKDAWKTIYYFYQTGDLMKIIRCPSVMSNSSKDISFAEKDTLIMIYREDFITKQNILSKNIIEERNQFKNLKCGGNISINIGLKDEIYKHPKDFQQYTFKIGEEPIELLNKYPYIKYAINKMKEGERATFIAMPTEKNILKPKKQFIYEIEIPNSVNNETIFLPFYSIIEKKDSEKYIINNRAYCGAVINYKYIIYNKDGKIIKESQDLKKLKIGSGELNIYIENLMSTMTIGESYMIFLTKDMLKENNVFTKNILKNDILFFNFTLLNVQK